MRKLNLVKLCLKIFRDFTVDQLRVVSSDLGVDADGIGLNKPSLKMEAVISLIARMDEEGRLGDLLNACARQRTDVDLLETTQFVSDAWTPKTLPPEMVDRVNEVMGFVGKPYSILGTPFSENNWIPESIATGCFCWRMEVMEMPIPEDFSSLEEYVERVTYPLLNSLPDLEKIRGILANEPVTAYISADCEWRQFGVSTFPCIVVAPTLDQFDVVRIEQTTAGNYDLQTGDLIAELTSIDQLYGIDILAADTRSIEFRLKRIPEGQQELRFMQWLHDFAPDIDLPSDLKYPIKLGWD